MITIKRLSTFLAIAAVSLTLASGIFAQNSVKNERRLRYVTSSGPSSGENPSATAPKSVSLEKSELADFDDARILERETFDLINLKRMESGLRELEWNPRIAEIARQHSESMAKNGFFSHTGLNGKLVDGRAADLGLDDWRAIGENIAFSKGFANPSSFAVERWMKSNGHRNNLLDAGWTESGLGVAITVDGKYFFTQIFMTAD